LLLDKVEVMAQKYRVLALREIKLSDREGKTHKIEANQPIAEVECDFALGTVLSMIQFRTAKLVEVGGGSRSGNQGSKPPGNGGKPNDETKKS
jgi:hypothetical protein